VSCKVDPKVVIEPKLEEVIPKGWPQPVYTFSINTLSEAKFQLGRTLFYDPILSKDNTISCATCHQNNAAFANLDHRVSHGINNKEGVRNAPALFNLTWHPYFMHDGGINHIEVQPLGPIANPIEMAENIGEVLSKLQASNKYRVLFNKAYGSEEIDSQKLLRALTQFMGMLYSYNSKYDRVKRGEKGFKFSEQEQRGYDLFLASCNACHKEPLFSDFGFRDNGLSVDPAVNDSGRARITQLHADLYKFKTPSLRNIELTWPYMHDGRFNSLQECLNHYTSANFGSNKPNLDPLLIGGLHLTADNKNDIIAFLKTLTDTAFVKNQRFNDPKYNP
jgi:cytochrome c peroxidase